MTPSLTTPASLCSEPSESRSSRIVTSMINSLISLSASQHHRREGQGKRSSSTRARWFRLLRRRVRAAETRTVEIPRLIRVSTTALPLSDEDPLPAVESD